jgi:DNA-directed RNA polymerase specialized sigma subunit
MNELSSSIQLECNKRLEVLYNKHHKWLGAVAFNISHNQETTEELVSELYLYLAEKCNTKLFYLEYDYDRDEKIDKAYNEVREELHHMKNRKGFASAMIYEHYWFSDKTLDEVSKDIRISKSTVFLAVKKVKKHLKQNIQNPFNND